MQESSYPQHRPPTNPPRPGSMTATSACPPLSPLPWRRTVGTQSQSLGPGRGPLPVPQICSPPTSRGPAKMRAALATGSMAFGLIRSWSRPDCHGPHLDLTLINAAGR